MDMNEEGIIFDKVSKKFRINPGGLSDAFHWLRWRMRPENRGLHRIDPEREIWALRDVSFRVRKGEVVGLIGPNGAGKSTILKILSRITQPTQGRAQIFGRVGALIEIGAGFHNELTGKENVYMNGVIMGMSRAEIGDRYDSIVRFSGLEKFMNTPLKKYSSGMRVRLGFAVAASMEPDVMLVDEVLAVGDADFQTRCVEKMLSFKEKDIAIIFVSHSMPSVVAMCDRCIFLKDGEIQAEGEPAAMVEKYMSSTRSSLRTKSVLEEGEEKIHSPSSSVLEIHNVEILDGGGTKSGSFAYGAPLTVRIHYSVPEAVKPFVLIRVMSGSRVAFFASMFFDGNNCCLSGSGQLDCTFSSLPLFPGEYQITGYIRGEKCVETLLYQSLWGTFKVVSGYEVYGFEGKYLRAFSNNFNMSPIHVPHSWRVSDEIQSNT